MTELPDIKPKSAKLSPEEEKKYLALLTAGPTHHPSANVRNPILGTMATYSAYVSGGSGKKRKPLTSTNRSIHERSIFEHTGYQQGYFIINPQWTSEASGIKRMRAAERSHYAWHSRPSHSQAPPLIDYILPLMYKKREKDALLRQTLQSAKEAQVKKNHEPTDREKLMRSFLPPMQMERSHTFVPSNMTHGSQYYKTLIQKEPGFKI